MGKRILYIRIILWSVSIGLVAIILHLGMVPFGEITYETGLRSSNVFIGKVTPAERVVWNKEKGALEVLGNPIYFSLSTSRSFDKAELELKYRYVNRGEQRAPIIEAGVLVDNTVWRYDLEPINNQVLNPLFRDWHVLIEGGKTLLGRFETYTSIADFMDNLPDRSKIALYNTGIDANYVLPDYEANADGVQSIFGDSNIGFRGSLEVLTYIKDENLFFSFDVSDLNQNKDADKIELLLFYDNVLLSAVNLEDDGVTDDTKEMSEARQIIMNVPGLPEGLYKLELKVNDDILTTDIKSKQSKIVFKNKLWVYQAENFENLYSNSAIINAQTVNPGKLQLLRIYQFNDLCRPEESRACDEFSPLELNLAETYKLFTAITTEQMSRINFQQDDVIISGNGLFAFDYAQFFNPFFKKIDSMTNVEKGEVDFILADYQEPRQVGEWLVSKAVFDLSRAYREEGKYGFLISIPGLKAEDQELVAIEIDSIKVGLQGKNIWQKIGEIVNR